MPDHARVFEPVVSGTNNLQCSVSGCKCRVREVYGFWSSVRRWWRGVPRVEAACRVFDQPLATFADGETIKVMRCFACLQTETTLPTVEQWLAAHTEEQPAAPRSQLHVIEPVDRLLQQAQTRIADRAQRGRGG